MCGQMARRAVPFIRCPGDRSPRVVMQNRELAGRAQLFRLQLGWSDPLPGTNFTRDTGASWPGRSGRPMQKTPRCSFFFNMSSILNVEPWVLNRALAVVVLRRCPSGCGR